VRYEGADDACGCAYIERYIRPALSGTRSSGLVGLRARVSARKQLLLARESRWAPPSGPVVHSRLPPIAMGKCT